MSNHFHLLIKSEPESYYSDEQVKQRIEKKNFMTDIESPPSYHGERGFKPHQNKIFQGCKNS
jgi:hypothetical protein